MASRLGWEEEVQAQGQLPMVIRWQVQTFRSTWRSVPANRAHTISQKAGLPLPVQPKDLVTADGYDALI